MTTNHTPGPDLLEACRDLLTEYTELLKLMSDTSGCVDETPPARIDAARAAIAKAELEAANETP